MDINLNRIFAANRPISSDFDQMQEVDAAKYEQVTDSVIRGPSLVVTDSLSDVAVEELEYGNGNPVRDDDLGKLVKSAFDLKPPEVPDFV